MCKERTIAIDRTAHGSPVFSSALAVILIMVWSVLCLADLPPASASSASRMDSSAWGDGRLTDSVADKKQQAQTFVNSIMDPSAPLPEIGGLSGKAGGPAASASLSSNSGARTEPATAGASAKSGAAAVAPAHSPSTPPEVSDAGH